MPEIGEYELSELQDRGDGLQDFDLNMSEVLRLMNACYAAGKADALPHWPPEDGAEFKWGNRESIFKFKFGRWSCSRLPQHEYEPFFILDIREQVALTVAWFKGELEEVK